MWNPAVLYTAASVHDDSQMFVLKVFFPSQGKKISEDKHMDSIRNEVDIKVHHDVMITSNM